MKRLRRPMEMGDAAGTGRKREEAEEGKGRPKREREGEGERETESGRASESESDGERDGLAASGCPRCLPGRLRPLGMRSRQQASAALEYGEDDQAGRTLAPLRTAQSFPGASSRPGTTRKARLVEGEDRQGASPA